MPVRGEMLRQRLDALVATFDVSTIEPDPLQLVLRYDDPRDQEIAGILAAAFACGRADIVVANVGSVLDRMAPSPFDYLTTFDPAEARRRIERLDDPGRLRRGVCIATNTRARQEPRDPGDAAREVKLIYRRTPLWRLTRGSHAWVTAFSHELGLMRNWSA